MDNAIQDVPAPMPAPTPPSEYVVAHGMIERSPSIAQLATALAKAQGEIKPAAKDSENPHFRSKYADLAAVWEVARDPLSRNGLAVMQYPTESTTGRVALTTMLAHSSGEWIATTISTRLVKDDPQGIGSAITYLRRYAFAAIVGVVADEDDDGNAAAGHGNGQRPAASSGQRPVTPNGQRPVTPNGSSNGQRPAAAPARQAAPAKDAPRLVSGTVTGVFRSEDGQTFAVEIDGTRYPTTDIAHAQLAKAAKQAEQKVALTLDGEGAIIASALADAKAQVAA